MKNNKDIIKLGFVLLLIAFLAPCALSFIIGLGAIVLIGVGAVHGLTKVSNDPADE